jgi:hypothetical protein
LKVVPSFSLGIPYNFCIFLGYLANTLLCFHEVCFPVVGFLFYYCFGLFLISWYQDKAIKMTWEVTPSYFYVLVCVCNWYFFCTLKSPVKPSQSRSCSVRMFVTMSLFL